MKELIRLQQGVDSIDEISSLDVRRSQIQSAVTVIIPCFNCRDTIATAVNSLISQSLAPAEILLVEDGKTIGVTVPGSIRSHWLYLNQGAYGARNHGLKHSSSEFITVHDADDWSHPQKLEMQVKALLDNPKAVYLFTRTGLTASVLPGWDNLSSRCTP